MRTLKHWLRAKVLAQPFYAEEIRMIGLIAQIWRLGMPPLHRLRTGR